ncbi:MULTISPECIES: acyl-CoA dehydrogenase family protein [unclassified Roseitalea]|uniref:acyl-CoA dehydrogenase family protein n=1 Tax=unclassified Roseitalea TaxID=2639107 RepID=UPI00273F6186|nr:MULTISPECIES: acyl-CoA dehydrogenase family protein [unclassified Roseitalea]
MNHAELTDALRACASDAFPAQGLDLLRHEGLTDPARIATLVAPREGAPPQMCDLLIALGRADLALGRIYEGHVNAIGLIARLASAAQRERLLDMARLGGLFGVWGADDRASPACLRKGRLHGRKVYASGASHLALALIPVRDDADRMVLVLADRKTLEGRFDTSWWKPLGMERTDSHAVDLEGTVVDEADVLGAPGRYLDQPFFGGGAIRFVAVQLGGLLAVWDATRAHLADTRRHADPHQAARLGEMLADAEAAYAAVRAAYRRIAPAIAWQDAAASPEAALIADAARTHLVQAGARVLDLAQRSVGCPGLMAGHRLERVLRDLSVYLRQPAPDAALCRAGTAAAEGRYVPLFDA